MSKRRNLIVLTLVSLLVFTSFALLADNTANSQIPEAKSPESPVGKQNTLIQERDRMGMRGVLYSQIPDTITGTAYACQLDSVYPFDADMCDDIMPNGTGWRIDSVTTWWHNWTVFVTYDSVPYFHFMVYKDSASVSPHPVDSPFIDMIVPQSNYTATAFDTISHKYRVDMVLPDSVVLQADTIYWIEVQPATLLSVNGQTGWIAEPGCGNGTGFFHRFPELGINEWTSAEIQHSDSFEVAMVLRGEYVDTSSGIPEENIESLLLSVDQLTEPGRAVISYSLSQSGPTNLSVYDIMGNNVRTLVNEEETPGMKTAYWDYINNNNKPAANGTYFIRLESDNKTATEKMFLAR